MSKKFENALNARKYPSKMCMLCVRERYMYIGMYVCVFVREVHIYTYTCL